MRFRLLGSLEVDDVEEPALLGRTKVRAVLAMLLLSANRPVSVDRLVEGLWGEAPPPTAHGALQNYVSQLRKALGPDVILTRPPGYQATVDPDEVDVFVFERLVAEAASADVGERAALLREALVLWRGPPLDDLAEEAFAGAEIRRLEELRRSALEDLVAAELELGRHAELLPELDAAIEDEPMRERLRALRMLALYRAGRQADALATYQEIRAVLAEIGLEPGEELRRLERAILRHDPAIAAPARPSPEGQPPRAGRRDRRTVTVVFADVSGSTVLGERLDPETLRDVMASFFGEMRGAIERHGGTVEKFAGDEVMAIFGAPVAHEDDALRAVRATEEMRASVEDLDRSIRSEHGVPFRARIGINTGEVVAGEASAGGTFVTGAAVNLGKRLQEVAQPGETVLSGATLLLVRDAVEVEPLGSVQLRGTDQTVDAYRLKAVRADQPGVARAFETPLVGRRRELDVLQAAFELARNERRCVFVTLIGGAGMGKTRLARELVGLLGDDARVLVGRCVPYGHGATYLPVVDALGDALDDIRRLLGGDDHVVARLSELMGDEQTTATAADNASSTRRALEVLARERPLLVVFDDVHWGEPTFLDLLEYVGAWVADAPVLLIAVARPDLLERRPTWADPEAGVAPLRLAPLDGGETRTLVDSLADDSLSEHERDRVAELAEGYPLFAEQLVAWAADAGGELGPADLPPTIEALLASRLDRLDPGERATLERASVVGRDFWHGAVAALTPPRELASVGRNLLALVRKGLVRPAASELPGEDALRFHHALVRDVAYAGIPKDLRAELHERCADWLDANAGQPDEVVGYHLERAYVFRRELGDSSRVTARLGADAGERLGRAGVRALARGDAPAAVRLLSRATDVLPPVDPRRVELLCELAISQRFADLAAAEATLTRAVEEAEESGDRRLELRARLELAVAGMVAQRGSPDEVDELASAALPVFEALSDDRSLARLWFLTAWVRGSFACQNAAWEEGTERALVHYRRSGWPTSTCLNGIGPALFFGPRPAARAIARCDELLGDAETDVIGRAHVTLWRAGLVALQGRFDEARAGTAAARRTYEEHGHQLTAVTACGFVEGLTEMLAGDYAAAEASMREGAAFLEAHGEQAHLANRAAELGGALVAQGRHDEAIEWSELAVRLSDEHDLSAQFTSRSVHATVLAENGRVEDAEELARAALELVDRTDALNQRGDVRLALAHVLRRGLDAEEAPAVAREAAELYRQKGNVVSAARALELGR